MTNNNNSNNNTGGSKKPKFWIDLFCLFG
jgi:hypothetical protein